MNFAKLKKSKLAPTDRVGQAREGKAREGEAGEGDGHLRCPSYLAAIYHAFHDCQ